MTVQVSISATPNENALKFSVNKKVIESGYKTFNNLEEATGHPLAAKLFENDGQNLLDKTKSLPSQNFK